MSNPHHTIIERNRRKIQALYFIRRAPDGVPMEQAPHLISKEDGMKWVNPDTVQKYLNELNNEGLIYQSGVGLDAVLKAVDVPEPKEAKPG